MTVNHLLLMPGLAAVALASASQAKPVGQGGADGTELVQSAVRFDDLDLRSPSGRSVLQRRVQSAARAVCAVRFDSAGTNIWDAACVRAALANANSQMTSAIAERSGDMGAWSGR